MEYNNYYLQFYPLVLLHHARCPYRHVSLMAYLENGHPIDVEAVQYIYMNVMEQLDHRDRL